VAENERLQQHLEAEQQRAEGASKALVQERTERERLAAAATEGSAVQMQARAQLAAVTSERNGLSTLVDTLKSQLAAKGAELAAQLESAAALAADKAVAEVRAREAERAKSRLELDVGQLKQVSGVVPVSASIWSEGLLQPRLLCRCLVARSPPTLNPSTQQMHAHTAHCSAQ